MASATLIPTPSDALDLDRKTALERLFRDQIDRLRLYPGAAFAIVARDQVVLDLCAGWADTQRVELVAPNSLFYLFSGTKPLVAVALLQQIERGRLELDQPVCTIWPEFGANGKDAITVRHLLTHRGGFPVTPPELTPDHWGDTGATLSAIAAMVPSLPPGASNAYHFLTQHWVIGEIVRRLDGRAIDHYVREEITGPLGMDDTHIGLHPDLAHRVVRLHATDGTDEWGIEALRAMHGHDIHRLVVPGASGVSTARDMARFYAAIANGGTLDGTRILQTGTVDRLMHVEVDGETDLTFNVPVRRGLGFELGGLDDPRRHWPGATSTHRTVWHGGFGSSVCWGDRETGLAMAFLANGVRRDEAGAIARRDLSDAVRAAFRD